MNIGIKLKERRKENNITQEQIADMVHVSRQTISNWENGKSYPDIESLLLLGDIYNVSLDELIKGDVEFMKKEVEKNVVKNYAYMMTLFGLLWLFSLGLISRVNEYLKSGVIVFSFTTAVIILLFAFKLEKIKKNKNLKTYQEIVDYIEDEN